MSVHDKMRIVTESLEHEIVHLQSMSPIPFSFVSYTVMLFRWTEMTRHATVMN